MFDRRLVGVVVTKGSAVVQSIGYRRYRPIGNPAVVVRNLDRWGVDEIVILAMDRSPADAGPDLPMLESVAKRGVATPIAYAGGIRSVTDARSVIASGADRVVVDQMLHSDPYGVEDIANVLGAQSVIASLPLGMREGFAPMWWDYARKRLGSLSSPVIDVVNGGAVCEALIIDYEHQGRVDAFEPKLLEHPGLSDVKVIAFGGISSAQKAMSIAQRPGVSAIAVGNSLNYREHAVQHLQSELAQCGFRGPGFLSDTEECLSDR